MSENDMFNAEENYKIIPKGNGEVEKYMYLYSIDKYILNEQPDVINCIKSLISKNSKVNIGVYKLITE